MLPPRAGYLKNSGKWKNLERMEPVKETIIGRPDPQNRRQEPFPLLSQYDRLTGAPGLLPPDTAFGFTDRCYLETGFTHVMVVILINERFQEMTATTFNTIRQDGGCCRKQAQHQ